MNKKVMALAVAGALTVPAVAMAQVTISGGLRASVYNYSVSNVQPAATGPRAVGGVNPNLSETRVADNVSQIIFSMREDLGGGLTATGRYEWRPTLDGAGNNGGLLANGSSATANWVGLESSTMGTLRVGSVNVYAGAGGTGGGYTADRALAFTSNVGIMQQMYNGAALTVNTTAVGSQVNFGQGRISNAVVWDSPSFNGFKFTGAWSSNFGNNDNDTAVVPAGVNAAARKGSVYILAPGYASGPFSAQYIYMNDKIDGFAAVGATAAVRDVVANKIWATYDFGNGFALTGAWNKVTLTNAYGGPGAQLSVTGGTKLSDQAKWMLSGQYKTGPHTFTADYTKAANDKILGGGTGAKQWAASWIYEFSKRTEVGLSYTKLTNDSFAAYAPQDTANAGGGVLGGNGSVLTSTTAGNAGESYQIYGVNITHKF